jgi:predicted DNA-binding transcriptional regulator AlpA
MSDRPLPGWPRGLRVDLAAEYLGISQSLFLSQVAAGRAPEPVQISAGRKIWLRDHLDAYLDRLAGMTPLTSSHDLEAEEVREWERALSGDSDATVS